MIYFHFLSQVGGSSGTIPESSISAVASLPDLDADIRNVITSDPSLLQVLSIFSYSWVSMWLTFSSGRLNSKLLCSSSMVV